MTTVPIPELQLFINPSNVYTVANGDPNTVILNTVNENQLYVTIVVTNASDFDDDTVFVFTWTNVNTGVVIRQNVQILSGSPTTISDTLNNVLPGSYTINTRFVLPNEYITSTIDPLESTTSTVPIDGADEGITIPFKVFMPDLFNLVLNRNPYEERQITRAITNTPKVFTNRNANITSHLNSNLNSKNCKTCPNNRRNNLSNQSVLTNANRNVNRNTNGNANRQNAQNVLTTKLSSKQNGLTRSILVDDIVVGEDNQRDEPVIISNILTCYNDTFTMVITDLDINSLTFPLLLEINNRTDGTFYTFDILASDVMGGNFTVPGVYLAGDYKVTVTDQTGLTQTYVFLVTAPNLIKIVATNLSRCNLCHCDKADIQVDFVFNNKEPWCDQPKYYIKILNSITGQYVSPEGIPITNTSPLALWFEFSNEGHLSLCAGTYIITVVEVCGTLCDPDEVSCDISTTITICELPPVRAMICTSKLMLDCHDSCDGFVELWVDGGIPPYTYSLNYANACDNYESYQCNWQSSMANRFCNLKFGKYLIKVYDNSMCEPLNVYFTVKRPCPIEIAIVLSSDKCGITTSARAYVIGGTPFGLCKNPNSDKCHDCKNHGSNHCGQSGQSSQSSQCDQCDQSGDCECCNNNTTKPGDNCNNCNDCDNCNCYNTSKRHKCCKKDCEKTCPSPTINSYLYSWVNKKYPCVILGTGASIDGLANGVYEVTVRDSKCCETTACFSVMNKPSPLNLKVTKNKCDECTFTIDVCIECGVGPYTSYVNGTQIDSDVGCYVFTTGKCFRLKVVDSRGVMGETTF